MAIDKIFNNKYKTGEIDFKEFGEIKLDPSLLYKFGHKSGDKDTIKLQEKFETELYEIFEDAPFFDRFQNPKEKIKKNETIEIFYYFLDRLHKPEQYSPLEKFTNIAEFLSMDYKILYKGLGLPYQSDILKEIDKKYSSIKRDKVKQLF
jgi:hypothetical protein